MSVEKLRQLNNYIEKIIELMTHSTTDEADERIAITIALIPFNQNDD